MMNHFLEKQASLKLLFSTLLTPEAKYNKLIELGKSLPPLAAEFHTTENLVPGCQSVMHFHGELSNSLLHLSAHSDALISKGLAALFIYIYSGETVKTILTCPPRVLEEIGIMASLSPTRSIGLSSIYQKLQKIALKHALDETQ